VPAASPASPRPALPAPRRSVWIHLGEGYPSWWGQELAAALSHAHPRLSPFLSFDAPSDRAGARVRDLRCVVPPASGRPHVRRFFTRERPQLLVMAGSCPTLPSEVLHRARRKGMPVLWVLGTAGTTAPRAGWECIDLACVPDASTAAALARSGLAAERVQVVRCVRGAPDLEATCAAAGRLLARDRNALHVTQRSRQRRWLDRLLETRVGRRVEGRFAQRIDGIEALREALGQPRHLLCLGNGPSSESAGIERVGADACLRVNSRWVGRGTCEGPSMVFTGNRTSLTRVPHTIFGFRNEREERLLVWRWMRRARTRRLRYFTFGRHFDWLDERRFPARPTNGAVMLATAIALGPATLPAAHSPITFTSTRFGRRPSNSP
jgi:hypothetical protein